MGRTPWNDFLARVTKPYVVTAVLPSASEDAGTLNALPEQRLLLRLIRKPARGDFAVTVSRHSGKREILCAFADSSDAALIAKAAHAHVSPEGICAFILDEPTWRKLMKIAGPPERHRRPYSNLEVSPPR
jgi:hypothetical protein